MWTSIGSIPQVSYWWKKLAFSQKTTDWQFLFGNFVFLASLNISNVGTKKWQIVFINTEKDDWKMKSVRTAFIHTFPWEMKEFNLKVKNEASNVDVPFDESCWLVSIYEAESKVGEG